MKATLFACASGAALLFGVAAIAGEPVTDAAMVETPSEGAPVQELTDPTAALEPTVEGEVAPEGEGDIDAEAEAEAEGEATVEGEVAPEGEGDIDAEPAADAEAPADAPADAAAPEAAEEPRG